MVHRVLLLYLLQMGIYVELDLLLFLVLGPSSCPNPCRALVLVIFPMRDLILQPCARPSGASSCAVDRILLS